MKWHLIDNNILGNSMSHIFCVLDLSGKSKMLQSQFCVVKLSRVRGRFDLGKISNSCLKRFIFDSPSCP